MNQKNKISSNRALKSTFRPNYPEGTIKWSNESYGHFITKCAVFYYMKSQGYSCWSEVVFTGGKGRADIVAILNEHAWIIEIVKSEGKESIELKKAKYPEGFEFKEVRVNGFDYECFKI